LFGKAKITAKIFFKIAPSIKLLTCEFISAWGVNPLVHNDQLIGRMDMLENEDFKTFVAVSKGYKFRTEIRPIVFSVISVLSILQLFGCQATSKDCQSIPISNINLQQCHSITTLHKGEVLCFPLARD